MKKVLAVLGLLALFVAVSGPRPAESACCYFAAKDKDVLQPAQKAFLTWDPAAKVESFTVQPKFEGNAADFGMVIPTRFTFSSEKLVYPLKITQISVKERTEALFYVQTAHKVDLPGDLSY